MDVYMLNINGINLSFQYYPHLEMLLTYTDNSYSMHYSEEDMFYTQGLFFISISLHTIHLNLYSYQKLR